MWSSSANLTQAILFKKKNVQHINHKIYQKHNTEFCQEKFKNIEINLVEQKK